MFKTNFHHDPDYRQSEHAKSSGHKKEGIASVPDNQRLEIYNMQIEEYQGAGVPEVPKIFRYLRYWGTQGFTIIMWQNTDWELNPNFDFYDLSQLSMQSVWLKY